MIAKKILLIFALAAVGTAKAQLLSDALLFSDGQLTTTARSAAVGNALGAIGGDMVSANINPAGLGIYRVSEFTITPMYSFNSTNATFSNEILGDQKNRFSMGNLGLLMHTPIENGKWKGVNIGVSYNRIGSFNNDMSFSGLSFGSRIQNFVASAQGVAPAMLNEFESQLAYDTYLIDIQDAATNTYVGALDENTMVRKSQFRGEKGGLHEFAMSLAGNYNHKFYIGMTLGLNVARYNEFRSYEEFEETGSIDFKRFVFDETRSLKGTGINAKLGALYRINKMFKIGAHIHTPTVLRMTEQYYTEMTGEVMYQGVLENNTFQSPNVGKYLYGLRTPLVWGVSASAVIKKAGFIGLDVEHVGYKSMKFQVAANDQTADINTRLYLADLSASVKGLYQSAWRARIGGEAVLDVFRLRAGYQIQTSPYQTPLSGISDLRHQISFGLGIRGESVFFDISYTHALREFEYLPYAPLTQANTQSVFAQNTQSMLLATLGFRFQ
jgi:hypothetical protein